MRFRPEAIHGASGVAGFFNPFPERDGDVSHISGRFLLIHDLTIQNHNLERVSAIQAREIYSDFLAREKPADCQRFKGSLAEPFLLPVNGDAVLGRQIVERGERDDVIGPGVKPSRYSRRKKVMEGLSSFFH
jgi:hypothetical protein